MSNRLSKSSCFRIPLNPIFRAIGLSGMLLALCLLTASPAAAQGAKKGPKGAGGGHGAAGAAGGHGAGGGAPPGMSPGMMPSMGRGGPGGYMPGVGGKKFSDKKTGPGVRTKPGEGAADEYDNQSLPSGYQVPPEPPEAFNIDEQWVEDPGQGTPGLTRRMDSDFKSIMLNGEFRKDSDKELVAAIVRYRLSQLTLKENREKAAELRVKLEKELEGSNNNKSSQRGARILALKTIAEEAPRLFEYHFVARLQGAILLAHLADYNETEADGAKKPAVPCTRAMEPLIALVNDGKQLTPVRVWGINGLVRLATIEGIKSQDRNRLVDILVAQMNSSGNQHEWYQLRLAEGLGKLTVIQNQDKRPVVPQALAMVLADSTRPILVRAEAAQSLGRLQYDSTPSIDAGLLAFETAQLTQQIIEGYVKDRTPKQTLWKLCLIRIYGGFKPLEDEDASKEKNQPKRGLLTQIEGKPALASHRKTVQEAFEVVLPLVSKVLIGESKEIDPALVNLKKWIELNPPKSFKIYPDEAPIISKANPAASSPAGEGVAAGTPTGK